MPLILCEKPVIGVFDKITAIFTSTQTVDSQAEFHDTFTSIYFYTFSGFY